MECPRQWYFSEDLSMEAAGLKGYTNSTNHIARYISRFPDLEVLPDLDECKQVSDLSMKFCTRVWTIWGRCSQVL